MPIFGTKKPKTTKHDCEPSAAPDHLEEEPESEPDSLPACRRKIQFHCQLAHGSPTGIISDFTNVAELYSKIASCYEIDPSEVFILCNG